jgi:NADP-dependent 3-hydroxy acid dehydrogenase YdfG
MNLQNKVIIITGASQGLGKSVALKAAKEGGTILLLARTERLLQNVKEAIENLGGKAAYFICDIRDEKQIKQTVASIVKQYPTIDILINNAGIWTDEELETSQPERRKAAFETNALGHIEFTKALLPIFQKQNSGYIFNVISTSGVGDSESGNNALWQTYGATKWAMTGFTKALKESLKGTKIKVTSFHPGGFESNLYENAKRKNPHDQPWMMKTEDVADIILFALTRPSDVLLEKIVVTKVQ